MSIQDIEVVEAFLTDKFKESFDVTNTNTDCCYFKSDNYKFALKSSFINNLDLYKDDIMSRLQSAFINVEIEKNKNYMMERSIKGLYIVTPYFEIEV
ncbi:hypothetical protein ACFWHB_11905 [Aeromonas mytilicola subsp. aquatica]|uniref:hypothetical protein n=1 Tax=Aeromonas mytilicola TaxID=3377113 RepID=UPI0037BF3196